MSSTVRGSERGTIAEHPATAADTTLKPSFVAFYEQCHEAVARALSVTLRDSEMGIEAADEAMARCFSKWPRVSTYDNPAGWAYRVGLNWAISKRRRLTRAFRQVHRTPSHEPSFTDPMIDRALRELDVNLRAVVVCRYLLDWSTDQTATALDIAPGTVKSRLHRALKRLQQRLNDYDKES